jgi:hypothetical protein
LNKADFYEGRFGDFFGHHATGMERLPENMPERRKHKLVFRQRREDVHGRKKILSPGKDRLQTAVITIKQRGKPRSISDAAFPLFSVRSAMDLLLFTGRDRLDRALFSTSAAVRTQVGIDGVLVFPLADCLDGTFILTGTASNAFIGDDIRHIFLLFFIYLS